MKRKNVIHLVLITAVIFCFTFIFAGCSGSKDNASKQNEIKPPQEKKAGTSGDRQPDKQSDESAAAEEETDPDAGQHGDDLGTPCETHEYLLGHNTSEFISFEAKLDREVLKILNYDRDSLSRDNIEIKNDRGQWNDFIKWRIDNFDLDVVDGYCEVWSVEAAELVSDSLYDPKGERLTQLVTVFGKEKNEEDQGEEDQVEEDSAEKEKAEDDSVTEQQEGETESKGDDTGKKEGKADKDKSKKEPEIEIEHEVPSKVEFPEGKYFGILTSLDDKKSMKDVGNLTEDEIREKLGGKMSLEVIYNKKKYVLRIVRKELECELYFLRFTVNVDLSGNPGQISRCNNLLNVMRGKQNLKKLSLHFTYNHKVKDNLFHFIGPAVTSDCQ